MGRHLLRSQPCFLGPTSSSSTPRWERCKWLESWGISSSEFSETNAGLIDLKSPVLAARSCESTHGLVSIHRHLPASRLGSSTAWQGGSGGSSPPQAGKAANPMVCAGKTWLLGWGGFRHRAEGASLGIHPTSPHGMAEGPEPTPGLQEGNISTESSRNNPQTCVRCLYRTFHWTCWSEPSGAHVPSVLLWQVIPALTPGDQDHASSAQDSAGTSRCHYLVTA